MPADLHIVWIARAGIILSQDIIHHDQGNKTRRLLTRGEMAQVGNRHLTEVHGTQNLTRRDRLSGARGTHLTVPWRGFRWRPVPATRAIPAMAFSTTSAPVCKHARPWPRRYPVRSREKIPLGD